MADEKVDLWAIDEVHFQQYGSRCRMWIPPEVSDPVLHHFPGRKSIGYFAAVRLRDGKFIYRREAEIFNGETFWGFAKDLRFRASHAGRKAIVISDNAKYHHSKLHKDWREKATPNFSFEFLPPYSPDLNPIERVWKLTRRLCTHNQYFPSLTAIAEAVEREFDKWAKPNDILRRLCAIT